MELKCGYCGTTEAVKDNAGKTPICVKCLTAGKNVPEPYIPEEKTEVIKKASPTKVQTRVSEPFRPAG